MDRLEEILRERLRIDDVADLARIAARTAEALGLSEEPPREEASARILDPAFFDAFAVAVLDSTLEDEVKLRVADLAFDLLQLPRTELEAFAVSQAIPAHLPRFAAFLARRDQATAQHLLEMIYALYHRALDADRLRDVTPADLAQPALVVEATDSQRILYAVLVATYPGATEDEALARFRAFVDRGGLPEVAREGFAASLHSREAFQEGIHRLLLENDVGSVDLEWWPFNLPVGLQKAAGAWAPL